MALWLRVGGWICFLGGGAFFLLAGAELSNKQNLLPWVGMFIMLLGMVLTSVANLVATIVKQRQLRRPPDPH